MADVKISAGTDPGTVVATDKVPLARSASTTAYAATMAELATYANGVYTPNYYTGSPSMDGTAAPGTLAFVARGDHVHPSDTARVAKAGDTMGGFLTLNANPTANLHAATKQYVDGSAPVGGPYLSVAAMHDVGRNLLHNAGFTVAQRGAGPWSTATTYTVDRWQQDFGGGTLSTSRGNILDAGRAAIGDEAAAYTLQSVVVGGASAGNYTTLTQKFEDVRRLAGKTVTVSFWASVFSGSAKLGVSFDQYFGSGGSPSAQVSGIGQSVTLTTTWSRYSLTFTIPSVSGKTLGTNNDSFTPMWLWLSAGTTYATASGTVGVQSATFQLWGVQLEIGSVATPLEKRDPEQELRQCQRFYQTGNWLVGGYGTAGMTPAPQAMHSLPVTMRANPIVALVTPTLTNASAPGATVWGGGQFSVYLSVTATGAYQAYGGFTASADL